MDRGPRAMIRKLAAGEVLDGRFEVRELVAGGGSSAVYRGVDASGGGEVAIKVLTSDREDFRQRFEREVAILAGLSHPVIVRYMGHGEVPTFSRPVPYLVTEWMAGETLSGRLRSSGLTMREAVALARDLAGALALVHRHDLVHRDVKPANIIFRQPGELSPVLIDFGIARPSSAPRAITGTGIMVGTPGFVSPEQARGSVTVGPPSDVFSLGCVLYLCLTGTAPFHASTAALTFLKIVSETPPPLRTLVPSAPPELERLLGDVLAKDAAARPQSGEELEARLAAIGEVPDGPPVTAGDDPAPRRRRSSTLPTGTGRPLEERGTEVAERGAILAIGGGQEALAAGELSRVGDMARAAVDATDVIALPEELIVIRASHVRLDVLVDRMIELAFRLCRELGDRVIAIAGAEEADWAVETAQRQALARLFGAAGVGEAAGGAPLVLVHE
ncbi:MAG TPA: serine/threonine-protein kinase, partial [Kofleriaceae bacterium]|nr:serine/threonine-protein kinase [Kofleriaceae bacterium]